MTDAKDAKTLFGTTVPKLLAENPDKAKDLNGKFQVVIKGAGEWFLDAVNGICREGKGEADCILSLAESDFNRLAENPHSWLMVLPKIKIEGNKMMALNNVSKLFDLVKASK
jgi:hypothetical protein